MFTYRFLLFALLVWVLSSACGGHAITVRAPAPGAPSPVVVQAAQRLGIPLDPAHVRIVACTEEAVDILLALALTPVGICSDRISGIAVGQYYELTAIEPQHALRAPMFIGTAQSPSLIHIARLEPQIILTGPVADEVRAQMQQIAPVFLIDPRAPDYWRGTLHTLSEQLGCPERADRYLADFDESARRLARRIAPVASHKPNILLLYAAEGNQDAMWLPPAWPGAKPFTLLGFNVLLPEGADPSSRDAVMLPPEMIANIPSDIVFVIRYKPAGGGIPSSSLDVRLAKLSDRTVIYQEIDRTRGSTAPLIDRQVLEDIAALLVQQSSLQIGNF